MADAPPLKPEGASAVPEAVPVRGLIVWAVMILILSVVKISAPMPPAVAFFSPDTVAHTLFYLPLGALCLWTFPHSAKWRGWVRAVALAFGYGFTIELIQAALPWRDFEWSDALANLIGSAAGAGLALLFPRLYLFSFRKPEAGKEREA